MGWVQGHDLEIVQMGDGVMLRPATSTRRLTVEEATRELRQIYQHEGPPIPIEKLSWSPDVDDPDMDLAFTR